MSTEGLVGTTTSNSAAGDFDDELSDLEGAAIYDPEDPHRPVSPHTPFESFFLSSELKTSEISAFALASQIRNNSSKHSSQKSLTSVNTDEFGTAVEHADDLPTTRSNSFPTLFGKDVLVISREPIPEESFEDTNMSHTTNTSTSDEGHFDVTQHVYEGVKGVWAWGKGVRVFKPFMSLAEGIADKVVGVAGTSLQGIDGMIKPQLEEIDGGLLNPTIQKIVDLLMNVAEKGDSTLRPILEAILGPLTRSRITSSDKKKESFAPEVTTMSSTTAVH